MIKHRQKITYRCNPTYTMVGANMQECDNGHWTNDIPMCKASCQPPANIAHGRKIGIDFSHGKTVRFECDAKHILEGNTRLTCNDGTWNSDPPKCKAVCPDPGVPTNGQRLHDNFQDGKSVTFRCNRNYDIVGNNTIRCNGGGWSSDTPECKGRCTFDGNPGNGYTTILFGRGESLPHGSNVEYACDVSFTLVGSNVRHCDDGSWNTSVPSCKAPCDDPGFIASGHKIGNDFSHGRIVTYQCTAQGYSLVGNPRLTCNDGKWDSKRPECKASCKPLPPPSDGNVYNNGTSHGTLVSFSCKKGFQLEGSQQIMCINGKWNGTSPTCKGTCKNPRQLENGRIVADDGFGYDSSINFVCNFGYDLRGPASLTCQKGEWNGEMPECKKSCQVPGNPLNGWRFGVNFTHGGVVTFRCKSRTYGLFGASKITCDEGEWSHPSPSCEARCSDPGIPDNGTKEGDDYRSRANVTFRCNPPLQLVGNHVIFCQDGKWSAARPTCSSCGRPLGLENNKNQAIGITSPADSINFDHRPSAARLNGPFAWCPSQKRYLQIDLGKDFKLTAIATQGGTGENKWVKMYRISFMAGETIVTYNESESPKIIEANKDASSVVKYKFKEPFVTKTVRIDPLTVNAESICLRTELYGCDPKPDCILVGSMFWGLWKYNLKAFNYYKAYITKLNETHLDFVLKTNKEQKRSYPRIKPVLVLDKVPLIEDITVGSPVIAEHRLDRPQWYRTGTVNDTSGTGMVSVMFDDRKRTKWVRRENIRLVERPRFCGDNN